jgi:hypothetical protein
MATTILTVVAAEQETVFFMFAVSADLDEDAKVLTLSFCCGLQQHLQSCAWDPMPLIPDQRKVMY